MTRQPTTNMTATADNASPTPCVTPIRSFRTNAARTTVTPGYSDVTTATIASNPAWVDKKYSTVAVVPDNPTVAAPTRTRSGRSPRLDRTRRRAAMGSSRAREVRGPAATGHNPLPSPARSSATNSSANATPANSPSPTPMARRDSGPVAGPDVGAGLSATGSQASSSGDDTSQIAGNASATPVQANGVGRSPVSTPTSTGMTAAHSALKGATTPMRPRPRPRYSASVPTALPTPLAAPHNTPWAVGIARAVRTSAIASTTQPMACPMTATSTKLRRRDSRPARKSLTP